MVLGVLNVFFRDVETTEVLKGVNPGDQVEFVAEQKGTKLFAKQFRKVQ